MKKLFKGKRDMQTLVIATGNRHKLEEIRSIFNDFNVISQAEAGFSGEAEENGTSFEENAVIKAEAVAKSLNCVALADDSGICVNALGGKPGIYSARYSGVHGDDKANRDLLLKNLEGKTDRSAYFKCAVALVYPDGRKIVATGETHGRILFEEEGSGGFGYDCIFFSDELNKSFGVASGKEKNSVSHRFKALQNLRSKL